MPAKVPESTSAETLENRPDGKEKACPWVLVQLKSLMPEARRFCLWLGAAALLMGAMRSVANHFFPSGQQNQEASGKEAPGGQSPEMPKIYGAWWEPSGSEGVSYDSAQNSGPGTDSPSEPHPLIPIDRGIQFSGGSLILNSGLPIGSNTRREAYEILGLRTSSFTSPSSGNTLASNNLPGTELSFSLSGDVNLVPTDNLATGAASAALIAAPEPSAGVMLGIGLAGLALKRRRQRL